MSSGDNQSTGISIVIPAFNEEGALGDTLSQLKKALTTTSRPSEIIVVNDGSTDRTTDVAAQEGVRIISHPQNSGYGRSLLTGIEAASHDTIVITDADGTYPIEELPHLLAFYGRGFHMAVAARQGSHYHSSVGKRFLRYLFRTLAEFSCGRSIPDVNSGFRVFDRRLVLDRKASLSTGFSFTTTITLLYMLNNLLVGYMPIVYHKRVGNSKVRLLRDSLRSLQIIITTIAQYNPLKLFLLVGSMNIVGNVGWTLAYIYFPRTLSPYVLLVALSWNTLSLIAAIGIVALGLLRPRR